MATMSGRLWVLQVFLLSMAGAFATAVVFVIVFTLSLPPSDGAYGHWPFSGPMVVPVMSMVAAMAGVLMFPLALLLLRRCDPGRAAAVTFGSVLVATLILTPFLMYSAVPALVLVTIAAMAWCRRLRWTRPQANST